MIGYRNAGQMDRDVYIVWYTGSEAFRDLYAAVMRAYTPLNPVNTSNYRSGSDSYSFWQQNYKTVFNIEYDFSPYYHSPSDLLQYLDRAYAREVIQGGLALLVTLDQAPPNPPGLGVRDRGNGSSLYVQWDSIAVLDWARYRVSVGQRPGVYDNIYETTSRSYMLNGLTENRRVYVAVSIIDQAGREGFRIERPATPRTIPLPPAGVTAEHVQSGARVFWRRNDEMDLRGYHVFRSVGLSGVFQQVTASPAIDTSYTDTPLGGGFYRYYVTAIDSSGLQSTPSDTAIVSMPTDAGEGHGAGFFSFRIHQNYPNPFNPATQIHYEVGSPTHVELVVHDVLGRRVAVLVSEVKAPGVYVASWDASRVPSGVYFYTLRGGSFSETKRMLLLR
jgi:hypothetical protein